VPTKNGWFGSSMASISFPSGERPEKTMPAFSNLSL